MCFDEVGSGGDWLEFRFGELEASMVRLALATDVAADVVGSFDACGKGGEIVWNIRGRFLISVFNFLSSSADKLVKLTGGGVGTSRLLFSFPRFLLAGVGGFEVALKFAIDELPPLLSWSVLKVVESCDVKFIISMLL